MSGAAPGGAWPYPTAAPRPWRELDQTSVMGFALVLSVVGAPLGIVLGVRGLRRTAGGRRSGRWAAVLAIVVGVLGVLAVPAGAVGLHWFRDHVKSIARVEVGECVDVVDDDDAVSFTPRSCDEPHRAEVVVAADWGAREDALTSSAHLSAPELCFRLAGEHYRRAARTGRYEVTLVTANDDALRTDDGDAYACYYTRADGRPLTGQVPAPGEKAA